jgi:GT2 family glycosyltransferase
MSLPDRRISIVVPCYNRAAYLNVLLQSLTWSVVPPSEFEIIVVNDGGVDHVELVAEAWRRRGLDVHVLPLRAGGAPRNNASARNAGVRMARYPIVLQTDPDIVFASDVLQRVRETLEPRTFCSCSGYYPLTREATLDLAFGAEGAESSARAYLERAVGRPNQVLSPDGVGGLHGAFACAKSDLQRVGGYDESFSHWGWEDRELLVTLAHDAGLTRRCMAGTTVVHLWHSPQRGDTLREELAAEGQWSRVAWEVQMQRASAEYPRSVRSRRTARGRADASDRGVFTADAYQEWAGGTDEGTDASRPAYQLFFDAHRLEAAQLRALGYVSVARALLYYVLERPWEPTRLEQKPYDNLDLALEELAACEEQLGALQARDAILEALARLAGGGAIASAARARSALCAGDLETARREAENLGQPGWTPGRAALGIEIALLAGRPQEAVGIAAADNVSGDYFETLRLESYRRLLDRLAPATVIATDGGTHADEDRSEFLYSSAMRSLTAGLDLAACLLLGRFLRSGGPAEPRLYEKGRQHLDAARERITRRAAPRWASEILSALQHVAAKGEATDNVTTCRATGPLVDAKGGWHCPHPELLSPSRADRRP